MDFAAAAGGWFSDPGIRKQAEWFILKLRDFRYLRDIRALCVSCVADVRIGEWEMRIGRCGIVLVGVIFLLQICITGLRITEQNLIHWKTTFLMGRLWLSA